MLLLKGVYEKSCCQQWMAPGSGSKGRNPVDQMQTYKFDSKAVTADTAPAFELEQPNRVSHHMQDLVGIERYTNG